ncbi:MAG: rRNA maturation RNase YbeY [Candidatus Caenarcaniphilales bacterium]|nr:rRNA maturation RNase YbeY [Candidatus Caenarcaniphilales bacterium]
MPITVINRDDTDKYPLRPELEENIDICTCADWEKVAEICFSETEINEHKEKEICLSFCLEQEIQELNKNFRNKDKVTDVLSFNSVEPIIELEGEELTPLGDIIICTKQAARQAEEYGFSLRRELIFLFIHGVLHLLGYDHETEAEAEKMFRIQKKVLLTYGILD